MQHCLNVIGALILLVSSNPSWAEDTLGERAHRIRDGIVSIGMPTVPATLDPRKMAAVYHLQMLNLVYQNLFRIGEDGRILGDLAESWEFSHNGLLLTITLGSSAEPNPPTVTDVRQSLSSHFWPDSTSVVATYLAGQLAGPTKLRQGGLLSAVEIAGPSTLRIRLKSTSRQILDVLAMPGFPIIPQRAASRWDGSGSMSASYDSAQHTWTFLTKRNRLGGANASDNSTTRSILVMPYKSIDDVVTGDVAEKFDVLLGVPLDSATNLKLERGLQLSTFSTLSFVHFFSNAVNTPLTDDRVRNALACLTGKLKYEQTDPNEIFTPLQTYLPSGVMPQPYYVRATKTVNGCDTRRASRMFRNRPLRIVLVPAWLPKQFKARLEATLRTHKIEHTIREIDRSRHLQTVRRGNYDLVSVAYTGTYSDPDGFADPLRSESNQGTGRFPTGYVFDAINKVRHADARGRLSAWAHALKRFETRNYVLPLYQLNLPMILHERLRSSENKYRFENELWRLSWKHGS